MEVSPLDPRNPLPSQDGPPDPLALRVAMIGDSGPISPHLYRAAYTAGATLARRGAVLFTGGRDGVMAAACRGAREAGGLTVGILPGDDPREGNPWLAVPVTTGLGLEWRSLVLIHAVDAVLMLGGGNGTLGELSAAYLNARPVVVLTASGGWSDRIRQAAVDGRYLDQRRITALEFLPDPEQAAVRAVELARQFRQGRFPGPSRWRDQDLSTGDVVTPA